MKRRPLIFTPVDNLPLIKPGINLAEILLDTFHSINLPLEEGDVLVITQKIVSKAENRLINLSSVDPSPRAYELAALCNKDPRLVELILTESKEVIRVKENTLIVEHNCGFICANAGIDHSNVKGDWGNPDDWVLLLPQDPDRSARTIREYFFQKTGVDIGVLIIDSHGRAWRRGTVGISIGLSGIPALVDMRGKEDLFGFHLKVTQIATADELAAAASLVMGQADEMVPVIHVRGFPYPLSESSTFGEILRNKEDDLFR
ncbi:MAG: F420-0:gamma-glutamyl ligase [Anaerolinea thermophila]|uniref:F420-0:gamma-glutamyl ligase n=1 Tax=Anaerolinea thermophila TaxID=167964 RepID=A0A124FN25_9CHLR|nr:MAG: F420-0:gamma-glutamyl ligase [Anaerolinea thermophila]